MIQGILTSTFTYSYNLETIRNNHFIKHLIIEVFSPVWKNRREIDGGFDLIDAIM